jgi:hypothetical protein
VRYSLIISPSALTYIASPNVHYSFTPYCDTLLLLLIVMYDHDIPSYHLCISPQVICTTYFVTASSPLLLLLQLPSPHSSFSYLMMSHTTRSSFSHGRYGLVEFLIVFINYPNDALVCRDEHMPVSSELTPLDPSDRRCQLY